MALEDFDYTGGTSFDPEGFDYSPNGPKRVVTCHTEGCENEDVELSVPDDGSPVICGPCNRRIA